MTIEIVKCEKHGCWAITMQEKPGSDGWGSGMRVTPSKCCGSWKTVVKWQVSETMIGDIRRMLTKANKELKASDKSDKPKK